MEQRPADLSTAPRSCRCHDSRRRAQRRRSPALGTERRCRVSGQSPHRSQGLSTTGRRAASRNTAWSRHVRQNRSARSPAQGRTPKVFGRKMAQRGRDHSAARHYTERIDAGGREAQCRYGRAVRGGKQKSETKNRRFAYLSNTASILNLSGFASLRDTSGIQGGGGFFTQRRQ